MRGYAPPVTDSDRDPARSAGSGYPPIRGSRRRWLEDWAGSVTLMLGAVTVAVAFLVRYWLWLWILAAVIIVTGVTVWVRAGAAAASRARPEPPDRSALR